MNFPPLISQTPTGFDLIRYVYEETLKIDGTPLTTEMLYQRIEKITAIIRQGKVGF